MKWMGGILSCLAARELVVSQSKTIKVCNTCFSTGFINLFHIFIQAFIDSITGNGLPAEIHVSEKYLESWPWEFSKSVVSMVHQMISHGINSFRYFIYIGN